MSSKNSEEAKSTYKRKNDSGDKKPLKKPKLDKNKVQKGKASHKYLNKTGKKEPLPKETAKSRKDRKLFRKKQNPNYELSYKSKKIWEKLRIQKSQLTKDEKNELVQELMTLVKSEDRKLLNLAYAHDTSRVLQTCIKQGSPEQRKEIFQELQENIVNLSKNNYAKNIVWKMMKYGTLEERTLIMSSFKGSVWKLLRKARSASVVEYAYNNYATAGQRHSMIRQLYGKVFRICQQDDTASLESVLKENPDKKLSILSSFKDSLVPFCEKSSIIHTLVHKAFYDFFLYCDNEEIKNELIEQLRESLIHMMHTHDGAHVTMRCLWSGTNKDRKVIIKTMKEFVVRLCCEEFGHLPILAAFDCVDDTVIVKKALIMPIVKSFDEIMNNKYGKKVIIYLMSPRNPSHFLPETVKLLSTGDNNATSKKPMNQRHSELTESILPGIMEYVSKHLDTMVFDRSLFTLINIAVMADNSDISPIIDAMLLLASKAFNPGAKENGHMHIIEDVCGHSVMKRIIIAESNSHKDQTFCMSLLTKNPSIQLASWSACNRGSQMLLALVESKCEDVSQKAIIQLKQNLTKIKENSSIKSTQVLLKRLE